MKMRARQVFRLAACVDIWEAAQAVRVTILQRSQLNEDKWFNKLILIHPNPQSFIWQIISSGRQGICSFCPSIHSGNKLVQTQILSTTSSLFSRWLKGWEWFMVLCVRLSRCHPANRDDRPNKACAIFQPFYFYLHGVLSYTLMKYVIKAHLSWQSLNLQ